MPRRADRNPAAWAAAAPLDLGISNADLAWLDGVGAAPPAAVPSCLVPAITQRVCRCPSVRRRGVQTDGFCACTFPGFDCKCECSQGRAAWCECCRVLPVPEMDEAERASLGEAARELERDRKRNSGIPPEDWSALGLRGEVAQRLAKMGLDAKAARYASCMRFGFAAECWENPIHKFHVPWRCGLRFCPQCSPGIIVELMAKYNPRILAFLRQEPVRPGWTLAQLTFTQRATGEAFGPEDARRFNQRLRKFFKLLRKRELFQRPVSAEGIKQSGLLWVDEVGFEKRGRRRDRVGGGRNLHAHGIYYGPLIDWPRARDLWRELSGATGFHVKQLRGWNLRAQDDARWEKELSKSLFYCLKYTGKVPAVTAERIAELEAAFNGVRRVHACGRFYRLPVAAPSASATPPCPECGATLMVSTLRRPIGDLPGRNLFEVARERGREKVFMGGP